MESHDNQSIALCQVLQHMVAPDEQALETFLARFSPRSLAAGDYFVEAGKPSGEFAFINSGLARFFYHTPEGKEFNKSFALENHFIGAYSAYLSGKPPRFNIQALEACRLLVARLDDIAELAESNPCWEHFRRLVTEQLYIRKEEREAELLLDDAATRYALFLQRYPGLETRIPQYHVASYLGITPVALSRIRKRTADNSPED